MSNAGREALAARISKPSRSSVRALGRQAPKPKKKKGTIDYAQSKELANYRKAAEKKKGDAKYAKSLATARRVKAKMKEKERLEKEKKAKEKKEKVAKKAKEMREKFKKKPAKKTKVAKPPCKTPKPVEVGASARAQKHCRKKPFGG